jgi:hypothetical protein
MTDSSGLSFDKAEYASGASASAPCANCRSPLVGQYWKWQNHAVCDACRTKVSETFAKALTGAAFRKAFLQGGGVAIACGIAYAIFVALTKYQIAFATIGIAVLVAKQIRKASGGASGLRFQVLAVALTYFASTMGYLPDIFRGLDEASNTTEAATVSTPGTSASPAPPAEQEHKASGGQALLAIGWLIGIMLAAPFLEITEAPIGVLIVLIGLWQAWKLSRGLPTTIEGPFQVAAPATGPPVGGPPAGPAAP